MVTTNIDSEINRLIKILESRTSLETLGKIRASTTRKTYYQYFLCMPGDNKYRRLKKDELEIAKEIVQRDYDERVLAMLKKMQARSRKGKQINFFEEHENILKHFCPGKRILIKPVIQPQSEFIEQWLLNNPGFQNNYPYKNKQYTNRNELVRSKSEKMIADLFIKYDIPYVIEPKLILEGDVIMNPDFLVLNKRTREQFYWEHLGLAGDDGYELKNLVKLQKYESNDLEIGKEVIITLEAKEDQINTKMIEKKIFEYLL